MSIFEKLHKIYQDVYQVFHTLPLDKIITPLANYIKGELYFGMYYLENSKMTPAQLLNMNLNSSSFKNFLNNKLDINMLLTGFSQLLNSKSCGDRMLEFLFRRTDTSKIFFDSSQPSNVGTGTFIYDFLNSFQSLLNSTSSLIKQMLTVLENEIKTDRDKITQKIVSTIKTKLDEANLP